MKSRSRRKKIKRTNKTKQSKRSRTRVSLSTRRKSKKKRSRKSLKIKKHTTESSLLPKQLLFSDEYLKSSLGYDHSKRYDYSKIVHFSPTLFIVPDNKEFEPVRIDREGLYVNYPNDGKVYPDHPVFQKYPNHWIMYKTNIGDGFEYVVIQTKDRVGIYAYGGTVVPHELSKRYRSFFNKYIQSNPLYDIEHGTIDLLKEVSYKSVLPGLELPDYSPNNNGTTLMIELMNNDYLWLYNYIYKLNFNSEITHYYSHKIKATGVDVFWFDDKGYLYIYNMDDLYKYNIDSFTIIRSNQTRFTNNPNDILNLRGGYDNSTKSYYIKNPNWPAPYNLDGMFSHEELNTFETIKRM